MYNEHQRTVAFFDDVKPTTPIARVELPLLTEFRLSYAPFTSIVLIAASKSAAQDTQKFRLKCQGGENHIRSTTSIAAIDHPL